MMGRVAALACGAAVDGGAPIRPDADPGQRPDADVHGGDGEAGRLLHHKSAANSKVECCASPRQWVMQAGGRVGGSCQLSVALRV